MGKIERFNRTLKQRLLRLDAKTPLTQTLVNDLISNYNDTYQSSIKSTPNEMIGEVDDSAIRHNQELLNKVVQEFDISDKVRYKLPTTVFGKEAAKWSTAVYEIVGVDGYKIQIRSKNNHTLYKPHNDLKFVNANTTEAPVEKNQIWEIERILGNEKMKNGKNRYHIKWKGFKETTWEPQDNLRFVNKNQMSTAEREYFKK